MYGSKGSLQRKPRLDAVVCSNVTGRTKKRIAQSKRACAGSLALALLTSHKWRELVSSGRLVCRCHGVFPLVLRLFCFASFFRLFYAFVEAAALRSIVLRYPGVPIATRVSFFYFFPFFVYLEMSLFPSIFSISLCMESTSYVLSFRMVFFLPCDHGLDF